jgi:uncharacterized membrane protein YfcA
MLFALLIFIVAPFLGALATFFTGFGLNTILVPVFMIYFDAPLAVLMAGIVHLCNNILKGKRRIYLSRKIREKGSFRKLEKKSY